MKHSLLSIAMFSCLQYHSGEAAVSAPSIAPLDETKDAARPSSQLGLQYSSALRQLSYYGFSGRSRSAKYQNQAELSYYQPRLVRLTENQFWCRQLFMCDKKAILFLENGSEYSISSDTITLREGKLIILANPRAIEVMTASGYLEIPPETSAVIKTSNDGLLLQIANIVGEEVKCELSQIGQENTTIRKHPDSIQVSAGKMVAIANGKTSKDQLAKACATEVLDGMVLKGNYKISEIEINAAALFEIEVLTCSNTRGRPETHQTVRRLEEQRVRPMVPVVEVQSAK